MASIRLSISRSIRAIWSMLSNIVFVILRLFVFFSGKALPGYTTGNMSSLPQLNSIATR